MTQHPQLDSTIPFLWPDETARCSLDFAPVRATKALCSDLGELDNGFADQDALLRLDRALAGLTLPRFPTVQPKDASHAHFARAATTGSAKRPPQHE